MINLLYIKILWIIKIIKKILYININNNREYYNPIDEYEIIENNKGISTIINNNNINNINIKWN